MDFDLKSLTPSQAAQLAVDGLLVLVPDAAPRGESPLER